MKKEFAVKSTSFALYEAFKKDCEKIGWIYDKQFCGFKEKKLSNCNCMYLCDGFNGKVSPNSFSLSYIGLDEPSYALEYQYGEALAQAEKAFTKPELSYEDIMDDFEVYGNIQELKIKCTNNDLRQKMYCLNKLFNVAHYLNPNNEDAFYSIELDEGQIIVHKSVNYYTMGFPKFISEAYAQKAIDILGIDIILTALK